MKKIILTFLALFISCSAFAYYENEIYCKNGKCALFKDASSDKLLLPLEYDNITILYLNKYAKASKDGKWELFKITNKAKNLLNKSYDEIYYFQYESFLLKNDNKNYLYNAKKNTLETIDLNIIDYLSDSNRYVVKEGEKYNIYRIYYITDKKHSYNYYKRNGVSKENIIYQIDNRIKYNFEENYVKENSNENANINTSQIEQKEDLELKKGKIVKDSGKYGFEDKNGEVKLESKYDKIYGSKQFAENYLIVRKDDKYAVYQINKNKLSDFQYDMAYISTKTPLVTYQGSKKESYNKKGYLLNVYEAIMVVPSLVICAPSCAIFAASWPFLIFAPDLSDLILAPCNIVEKIFPKHPSLKQFPD